MAAYESSDALAVLDAGLVKSKDALKKDLVYPFLGVYQFLGHLDRFSVDLDPVHESEGENKVGGGEREHLVQ